MLKLLMPGFLLTSLIGTAAYFISTIHDSLDALVVALIVGMLVRGLFGQRPKFELVIAYAKDIKNVLIPIGVILYAATINVNKSLQLPISAYVHTAISVFVLLIGTLVLGKLFGLSKKMNWLTAVGSAICGASAIAITSTVIDAKDEDVSNSLIATTLVGLIAVSIYHTSLPFIKNMDIETYAVMSGATLHQTGMVKIATSAIGSAAADIALPVKVLRISLIPFVALFFFNVSINQDGYRKGTAYLLILFVSFIFLLSMTALIPEIAVITKLKSIKIAATIVFGTAFANLGMLVDFNTMQIRPILAALLAWITAVTIFVFTT